MSCSSGIAPHHDFRSSSTTFAAVQISQTSSWLQGAAERGDMYAEYQLSLLYKDGRGVEKDEAKYLLLLKRSGTQGYVAAQRRLSGIYEKGKGVPKDLVEASDWAKKAAEQGDAAGIGTLVVDYRYGRGVPIDYVQALKWQMIGIALGFSKSSDQFTDELIHQAGDSNVAEAKRLADEWLDAYHKAN
jgi:uncharacterized protein